MPASSTGELEQRRCACHTPEAIRRSLDMNEANSAAIDTVLATGNKDAMQCASG